MTRTPLLPWLAVAALLWATATPAAAQLHRRYSAGKGGSTATTTATKSATPPPQSSASQGGASSGAGDSTGASTATATQGQGGTASASTAATQGSAGGATQMMTTETVPVAATTTTPVVAVASLSLVGRIRTPDATPVAGITVEAHQGSRAVTTKTDRTGTYTLSLPAGQWTVSASDLDYDVDPARKVYQVDTAAGTITRIE